MTGQNTAATGTAPAPNGGAIDVDAWRRRIRADAFGRYHYEMGIAILAEGNLPAAIQHLQTAIDTDPTLVDAYYHLGRIGQSQGQTAEAEALYARARAQDPGFPAGTLVRMALRTLDRNAEGDGADQAVELAQQALAHDPTHREAPWIQALVQARQGRLAAAAALRAADGAPRTTGRDEAADLAWRFYRLAETWREAGGESADVGEAVSCALVLDPDLPQALGLSAALLHESGQAAAAEPLLRRAVSLQPGLPWLHAHLGSTLNALGRGAEAVAELRLAAADLSDNFWVLGQLGEALNLVRAYGEAVAALRTAVRLKPGVPWVLGQLGIALANTNAHDEAIAVLRAALEIEPDVPWMLGQLGAALYGAGRVEEAVPALESALRHAPANAWLLAMLGEIRVAQTRFDDAAALFRQALDHDPSIGWVHARLGDTLFKAGRLEEAQAVLATTSERFPDQAVDGVMGLVLLTVGKGDEAAQAFRRALDRAPLPWLHEGLVTALLMTGRTAVAADAFAAGWAAGMDPLTAAARLLTWPPPAGLAAALTTLRTATPGAVWPVVLMGLAQVADGNANGAAALLNGVAGESLPQTDPVWTGTASIVLGMARTVAGDPAGGLEALDRGLSLAGAAGTRWRTYRGLTLHALGRLPEAEAEHRATLALIPEDSAARLALALTLDAQGRTAEGRNILRLAEGQNPGRVRALCRLLPAWAGPALDRLRRE